MFTSPTLHWTFTSFPSTRTRQKRKGEVNLCGFRSRRRTTRRRAVSQTRQFHRETNRRHNSGARPSLSQSRSDAAFASLCCTFPVHFLPRAKGRESERALATGSPPRGRNRRACRSVPAEVRKRRRRRQRRKRTLFNDGVAPSARLSRRLISRNAERVIMHTHIHTRGDTKHRSSISGTRGHWHFYLAVGAKWWVALYRAPVYQPRARYDLSHDIYRCKLTKPDFEERVY